MPQVYTGGFNCSSDIGNNGIIKWWNFGIKIMNKKRKGL